MGIHLLVQLHHQQVLIMAKAMWVLFAVVFAGFCAEASPLAQKQGNPPNPFAVAKMARYVLHASEWTSMSTISTHEPLVGYPFVNVFSVSDGPLGNSTGIPYFYVTDMEISMQDLKVDPRASITLSLAQSDYCREKGYDPESPLCAHIICTGEFTRITDEEEKDFAKQALFSRHPEMNSWPTDHGWFFAKLDIKNIYVLDFFGGIKTANLDKYYKTA